MTKILLVEDDKSLREIYGVRLLAEGYDIVSAGDGEEALAMAIKERPQLIVSDVMMPKISGFDMLDILRSTTETKDIKVIMMTALSSEDQRARGESLGADRYLVKSQVGIEDVVRTVHEVLGDTISTQPSTPSFSTPQPAAGMRPSTQGIPVPQRESAQPMPTSPAPSPFASQQINPIQAASAPQSTAAPTPQPAAPQAAATQPLQQSAHSHEQGSALPQPTAPFSTQRPANLGDRIIHPLERDTQDGPDLARLIDQELGATSAQPSSGHFEAAPTPTPAPQATPTTYMPTPEAAPIFTPPAPAEPQMESAEDLSALNIAQSNEQPPIAPQNSEHLPTPPPIPPTPPSPYQYQQPAQEGSGIAFEETPRQQTPNA